METKYIQKMANNLNLGFVQVQNTINLLAEDATIPFIARYRKEATSSLDEVQIAQIVEQVQIREVLENRRVFIVESLIKQEKLTDRLKEKIKEADTITELEDIYLPYKIKKTSKCQKAIEKGLKPLAELIFKQDNIIITEEAQKFVTDKVANTEEALEGARDIIASWVNEDKESRDSIRYLFATQATIKSKVLKSKMEEAIKFKDYYNFEENINNCPSHRYLAIRRGEKELFLLVTVAPPLENALSLLNEKFVTANNEAGQQVVLAVEDSYKRLLRNSIENEFSKDLKEKADKEAIEVFAENLRQLLLESPLGQKNVLALDPGFRTGCKVVCLDKQGNLLHNTTIYPNPPQNDILKSGKIISDLIKKFKIDAIAIGNGTASRETETFINNVVLLVSVNLDKDIQVFVVSENGASIYSASENAREEFPDLDLTVRGSISIGRRLMDPLAELVKIDPKSIGVGQYQHDVDQVKLKDKLKQVTESCVNLVGVNINTASMHLLKHVSGLSQQLAQNIVDYRTKHGAFKNRDKIKKVKRMGPKSFEQCAGFLRISGSKNPLDNSAVHPESYYLVEKMALDLGCKIEDLLDNEELRQKINLNNYVDDRIGLPTLEDIVKELAKPGLDPRKKIVAFSYAKGVQTVNDLTEDMILPGIVTNITNFGAFVDIGIKQDGLVHISEMADKYVSNPADIVKLRDHVKVRIVEIDKERNRIQLSMKGLSEG